MPQPIASPPLAIIAPSAAAEAGQPANITGGLSPAASPGPLVERAQPEAVDSPAPSMASAPAAFLAAEPAQVAGSPGGGPAVAALPRAGEPPAGNLALALLALIGAGWALRRRGQQPA